MQSVNQVWLDHFQELLKYREVTSRDGNCREMIGAHSVIDPDLAVLTSTRRRMHPVYAAAEMLWYLSGTPLIKMITFYAPQYQRFAENSEEGMHAWGAYGWRWSGGSTALEAAKTRLGRTLRGEGSSTWNKHEAELMAKRSWTSDLSKITQTLLALQALEQSPSTRQAVMTCYDAGDLLHAVGGNKKDIPCTLNLQFLSRSGELSLITTMRSNDLWLGFPYDVFCFTTLQRLFAKVLGLKLGCYIHNVGSLHLYTRDQSKGGPVISEETVPHSCDAYNDYAFSGRDVKERYYALGSELASALEIEKGFREKGWKTIDIQSLEDDIPCPILRDLVVLCASKSVTIDPEWIASPALRHCFQNVDPRRS